MTMTFYKPPFRMKDILALEESVIVAHGLTLVGSHYFKEKVGQVLIKAWRADPADTRIVTYSMPLMLAAMVRRKNLLSHSCWDDVFQGLALEVLGRLGGYIEARGALFTFLTLTINFAVLDLAKPPLTGSSEPFLQVELDEDVRQVEDEAVYAFADFLAYLRQLRLREGQTSGKILGAMLEVLTSEHLNVQKQCHLIDALLAKTRLPKVIVKPYFERVLNSYLATQNLKEEVADADPDQGRCPSSARIA